VLPLRNQSALESLSPVSRKNPEQFWTASSSGSPESARPLSSVSSRRHSPANAPIPVVLFGLAGVAAVYLASSALKVETAEFL